MRKKPDPNPAPQPEQSPTRDLPVDRRPAWQRVSYSPHQLRYDPEEFQVPGKDEKGHGSKLTVSFSPMQAAEMQALVEGRVFPYQTVGELVRHACFRHIVWLRMLEPGMPKLFLACLMAASRRLAQERVRAETERIYRECAAVIEDHIQKGDYGEVVRLVYDLKTMLNEAGDSAQKRRCLERFRRTYAHYLSPVSKVTIESIGVREVDSTPCQDLSVRRHAMVDDADIRPANVDDDDGEAGEFTDAGEEPL